MQYFFQGRHFLKLHPLSFGANYVLPGAQVTAFIGNLTQFSVQLYTVSEVVGSFLDEIKDEGGTIHFCGALDKVSNDYFYALQCRCQEWKSCLETITPDSPYMLLENGEYATLPENLNFIFEVGDLENELPENIVEQVETNQTLCQGGRS